MHTSIPFPYHRPPNGPAPAEGPGDALDNVMGYHRQQVGDEWFDIMCLCRLHVFGSEAVWLTGFGGRPLRDSICNKPRNSVKAASKDAPPPPWAKVAHRQVERAAKPYRTEQQAAVDAWDALTEGQKAEYGRRALQRAAPVPAFPVGTFGTYKNP